MQDGCVTRLGTKNDATLPTSLAAKMAMHGRQTCAGENSSVGSVVVGVGRALPPPPGLPLRGVVSGDPHCCPVQVLLISGGRPKHPLAGLHIACWDALVARLPYDVPAPHGMRKMMIVMPCRSVTCVPVAHSTWASFE